MSERSGRTASVTPENSFSHEGANALEVNQVRGVGRPPRGRGRGLVTSTARRSSSAARRGRGRGRVNVGKRLNGHDFRDTINEEVTRALQAALPEVIAQIREADRKEGEEKASETNTKTRTVTGNSENSKNTKITRSKASTGDTMPEEEEYESENKIGRKKKGCNYKSFSACHPPVFNGEGDAMVTMKWIREMESVIETSNCADEEAVKYAVHSFKSEALFWWDNVKDIRGPAAIRRMTWEEFKEILMEKFCPEGEINQLEQEFLTLEQGNMSMREYTTRFNEKARFAPHQVSTEKRRVNRYIWGMKPGVRELVRAMKPKTYQEAVEAAAEMEKEKLRQSGNTSGSKRKWEGNSGESKRLDSGYEKKEDNGGKPHCKKCYRAHSGECKLGSTACYKCGSSGHMSRECPQWSCYNCGGSGHVKSNCPNLNKAATGNLQITDGKSDKSGGIPNAKGRAYIMTTEEAEETPDVVSGTFLVNNVYANVLFDSGANRSFVSATFCHYLNKDAKKLDRAFLVELDDGGH